MTISGKSELVKRLEELRRYVTAVRDELDDDISQPYAEVSFNRADLDTILSALQSQGDGMVRVPREPTLEMLEAFIDKAVKAEDYGYGLKIHDPRAGYRAMIAAATPAQPQKDESNAKAWKCPINFKGCTKNCGDYGCGN